MSKGATISVCMIVRDESPVLARCLDGVSVFADEIIIVDTGSVDDTRNIALKYTDKVYDFKWIDDFSAARNVSYSYATKDYIMWLDADDVVDLENAGRIVQFKQTQLHNFDVVFFLYGANTDQKNVFNNTKVFRDRLVRRSLNPRWHGRLHECIDYPHGISASFADDIIIRHCKVRVNDPERNMRIHKLCMSEETKPDSRDRAFLCNEYFSRGDFESVLSVFEELISQNPFPVRDIDNALFSYIWSMKQLGKIEELIGGLLFIKDKGLLNEMLLSELGAAYLSTEKYDEAEHYLKEALDMDVDYRDMNVHFEAYEEFVPCQKLSKLYSIKGNMELAHMFFERAEKIYPENPSIKLNRKYFDKVKMT